MLCQIGQEVKCYNCARTIRQVRKQTFGLVHIHLNKHRQHSHAHVSTKTPHQEHIEHSTMRSRTPTYSHASTHFLQCNFATPVFGAILNIKAPHRAVRKYIYILIYKFTHWIPDVDCMFSQCMLIWRVRVEYEFVF